MIDTFDKALLKAAAGSPGLQQALLKNMSKDSAGYSIPTGDIHLYAVSRPEEAERERAVDLVKKADSLTVGQLCKLLAELKPALIIKEVQGEELQEFQKTLRDIDISALAAFALVEWIKEYKGAKE